MVQYLCVTTEGIDIYYNWATQCDYSSNEAKFDMHDPYFIMRAIVAPCLALVDHWIKVLQVQEYWHEKSAKKSEMKCKLRFVAMHHFMKQYVKIYTEYGPKTRFDAETQVELDAVVAYHEAAFGRDEKEIVRHIRIHGVIQAMLYSFPEIFGKAAEVSYQWDGTEETSEIFHLSDLLRPRSDGMTKTGELYPDADVQFLNIEQMLPPVQWDLYANIQRVLDGDYYWSTSSTKPYLVYAENGIITIDDPKKHLVGSKKRKSYSSSKRMVKNAAGSKPVAVAETKAVDSNISPRKKARLEREEMERLASKNMELYKLAATGALATTMALNAGLTNSTGVTQQQIESDVPDGKPQAKDMSADSENVRDADGTETNTAEDTQIDPTNDPNTNEQINELQVNSEGNQPETSTQDQASSVHEQDADSSSSSGNEEEEVIEAEILPPFEDRA